jgi:hypothetical protein
MINGFPRIPIAGAWIVAKIKQVCGSVPRVRTHIQKKRLQDGAQRIRKKGKSTYEV